MARPPSWIENTPRLIEKLDKDLAGIEYFYSAEVQVLFELGTRAAERLIRKIQPQRPNVAPRISRQRLVEYLTPIANEERDRQVRIRQVLDNEHDKQTENNYILRRFEAQHGKPLPQWKLAPLMADITVARLPKGISLAPGEIRLQFSADDPSQALEQLQALASAFISDPYVLLSRISNLPAPKTPEEQSEQFLQELFDMKYKDSA